MSQNSLTIIVPILQDKVKDLLDYLKHVKTNLGKGIPPEFEKLGTIHYARWVVIDNGRSYINDPKKRNPKLIFVVDYDGKQEDLLNGITTDSADILDKVYGFCEKYQSNEKHTPESRKKYLEGNIVKDTAVYIGAPGRTVKQVKEERDLRNAIRKYLDSQTWDLPAKAIHQKIKDEVLPQFESLKGTKVTMPRINIVGLVFIVAILLAVALLGIKLFGLVFLGVYLCVLLLPIAIWLLILHYFYERKDENFTLKRSGLDDHFLTDLETYEDFKNQNQFSQLVDMKEGKVRLITIKAMFSLSKTLISMIFVKGKLMGIPTIHFAKWVMFEDNTRVLFFSNFDGSWQQYLGDFIDNSGWGLTGIFSNTKVFPKTNFLVTGGAYDEEHFLAWSRNSEVSTNVWYAAYPELSIKNVNNNTKIRVQLMKSLSERQAAKFLKLI